jgi:outer membrane translocation and assembly module TamA
MSPGRRKLIVLAAVVVALITALAIVVHLPGVQRTLWERVAQSIEEETGWQITAEDFAVRAMFPHLDVSNLTVMYEGRVVASVEHLEAKWSWLGVVRAPRRIDRLVIEGVAIDPAAVPEGQNSADEPATFPWRAVEIEEFRVADVRGGELVAGIEVTVDGMNIDGRMTSGLVAAKLRADRLAVEREGRVLDLGRLELEARGSSDEIEVRRLALHSQAVGLSVTGQISSAPPLTARFAIAAETDLATVSHWWDPNLATGLEPHGRLDLEGEMTFADPSGLMVELRHRGMPFRVAGYDVARLELAFEEGQPTIHAAHPAWGRAEVTMTAPGVAALSASLDEAPVDRAMAFVAPRAAALVGQPATLSGHIEGTISYPIRPEFLEGQVDLEMQSPRGRFVVQASGKGTVWNVTELETRAMGAIARARGGIDENGVITGNASIGVSAPAETARMIEAWLPALEGVEIGGGPLEGHCEFAGALEAPEMKAAITWTEPVIAGYRLGSLSAAASGPLDRIEWRADTSVASTTSLSASGSARPLEGEAEGTWILRVDDLARLMTALALTSGVEAQGRFAGSGTFGATGGGVRIEGKIAAPEIAVEEWAVERIEAEFIARQDHLVISRITAGAYAGTMEGKLEVHLADVAAPMAADLWLRDVDLATLPIELPAPAVGLVSGKLGLEGSLARPEGDLQLSWRATSPSPLLVEDLTVLAGLSDGTLSFASEQISTAAGRPTVDGSVPLGDLPLPEWMWPDAPHGPVRATIRFPDFSSAPLMEAMGIDDVEAVADADLRADLAWDPLEPNRPRVLVEARNFRIRLARGELTADRPLVLSLDGKRLELAPAMLVGLGSRVEASAVFEPVTQVVDGRLRARLAPEVAGLLPLPFTVEGEIRVNSDFEFPADRSLTVEAIRGVVEIDHRGGRLVMRDPPVEIRDLLVIASLDDGVLDIADGSATVNRGRVEMSGGWDPESRQGVVFELDSVTTMVAGILTQWNGNVSVEPDPDRLAHLSGDLTLAAGLWDERIDIASAMLGGQTTLTAEDDYLRDLSLDMTVRGLAGIRVENNLGRFDVNWDQILVSGTAASPVLRGELRIASGGVLSLAGQEVVVRRGVVEFTGNPDVDPLLEIVPESDTTLFGDDEGVGATELATRGLAQGITSALGFENETLRPAEIAVQTETDPSVRFMVGQRLSRRLALFLAANLTDVQDRMTMLQYWNIPRFKGLAMQAYQETAEDNLGGNIFQRFEWGGTKRAIGRTEIHRLRLDGEWPMSRRNLRRATRLRRGQPFDPFLLFVAAVRMERVLAENGWQNARVIGRQVGRDAAPTLVFTCDPGERQVVTFEGDDVPSRLRREVTALYRRPPLESTSFDSMTSLVRAQVVSEGFIRPEIEIGRRGDAVVVNVRKGQRLHLDGPYFDGMPVDAVIPAFRVLGTPEALALAVDRKDWAAAAVERILKNAGYLEAKIIEVSLVSTNAEHAEVHLSVAAGPRSRVGSVKILGEDPLGLTAKKGFSVQRGMPLDRPAIDAASREIRRAYVEEGFREAAVRSSVVHADDGQWRVELAVDPGRRRTVREIRFTGRRDASPKVLVKGVTLAPGEVVTDAELDRSASNIANFSPVARDRVQVVPVGADQADLEFDVVEKRRWTVEVGGGWSTERSFGAAFGARDDNLFGRGVGLNLRGSLDSVEKRIFLLGSIPPVPGGRLSFISTIGYSTGDAPDEPDFLNQDQKLASLEASYRLPKDVQVGIYYRWTDTRTYEKVPDDFFPLDISVQVGTLGARTVVERFDYLFDPRSGWGFTSDLGWSGAAIGSDLEYVRWLSGFSLALEPFKDATWMQSLRIGVAEPLKGTNLDREARFFAGGQSSVRGFDLNTVGPVTYGFDGSLVPAGGGALFVLNEELRIPIWDPLRLAVFADIGQVWESWREADTEFSIGVGFGVRWSTPIGPLWADVAWPVANVGISSSKPKFYLGIGRPF